MNEADMTLTGVAIQGPSLSDSSGQHPSHSKAKLHPGLTPAYFYVV